MNRLKTSFMTWDELEEISSVVKLAVGSYDISLMLRKNPPYFFIIKYKSGRLEFMVYDPNKSYDRVRLEFDILNKHKDIKSIFHVYHSWFSNYESVKTIKGIPVLNCTVECFFVDNDGYCSLSIPFEEGEEGVSAVSELIKCNEDISYYFEGFIRKFYDCQMNKCVN